MRYFLFFFFIFLVFSVLNIRFAFAQSASQGVVTPIITWRAVNYHEGSFLGKSPATPGSIVRVSLSSIRNGKLYDFSQVPVSFFVDDVFFSKGNGLREISFPVTERVGGTHDVSVRMDVAGSFYSSRIQIPVASPKVLVKNPEGISNNSLTFSALPYFFSVRSLEELLFTWSVDSVPYSGGGSNQLVIKLPSPIPYSQLLRVEVSVTNPKSLLEFAKSRTEYSIIP